MSIPSFVISRPVATATLVVAALVLGCVSLTRLPVAYLPEIEGRSLTISVAYRSSSPEEVERTLCRPLEEELASLTGLDALASTARADGATISIELESGADPDRAGEPPAFPTPLLCAAAGCAGCGMPRDQTPATHSIRTYLIFGKQCFA